MRLPALVRRGLARPRALWAFARDPLQRQVLRLALPAVGEQVLSLMVGLVDTWLVGHLGKEALAAVGLANQWVMLVTTLFQAVAVGTTALIARAVGGKDWALANQALRQSVLLAAVIGVIAVAVFAPLARPAVTLLGPEEQAPAALDLTQGHLKDALKGCRPDRTIPWAATYLRTVAMILLFSTLMFVANAAMRGAGDTRTPMLLMLVVNGLNALLAWLLVNGIGGLPQLGVQGSAIGAATGRAVGGVLALVLLLRGRKGLRLSLTRLRPDLGIIRRILRVGLSSGLESLLFRGAQMTFYRVVAGLGTAALAAQQVVLNAASVSFLPGFGFAVAGTTLVGQGLGARDLRRAERSGYAAFFWGCGMMMAIGLALLAFPTAVMRFFTTDPQVIALGTGPLRLLGLVQPLLAATMIFAGGLRGAGDTRTPLWINALSLWLLRVPLAVVLTQGVVAFFPAPATTSLPLWFQEGVGWGLAGAWTAAAIDLVVRGGLMAWRYHKGRWKQVRV